MPDGDADRLKRKIELELERRRILIEASARQAFQDGKSRFIRTMTTQHLTGPTSASSLAVRTGQLRRSLDGVVVSTPKAVQLTAFIGGGVPYARIHEDGGIIRPKKSKYLTIPLGPAKTAAGVTRASARNWPVPLKFIKTKKGTKLLVEAIEVHHPPKFVGWGGAFAPAKTVRAALRTKRAQSIDSVQRFKLPGGQYVNVKTPKILNKGALKPVFLLVDQVYIPPRMNFRRTFEVEGRRTLDHFKADLARIMSGGK